MQRIRVLLADDHAILLEALLRLLQPEFEIVGAVSDGRSLVDEVARLSPDVVVLDIGMPLLNGIEASRQIRATNPGTKIIFLTQQSGRDYAQKAFQLGASGYVVKNSAATELVNALREVCAGRYYVASQMRAGLRAGPVLTENPSGMFGTGLTPRQREVLQLVAQGKSAKEIAYLLSISVKSVEFHKGSIMDNLGLRTTAELTRYALRQGIMSAESAVLQA
ncbi:MAG TPA: response regulator transcription factor [Bryobacteraceae bacterium]|nr:response regulator transcription factor [Bryobacteraceae bacterium]